MNSRISYVSRKNSVWIKGLLTLLIILGHDMVFTLPLQKYGVMSYFYTFHIQGFFILPFLYGVNEKPYTKERIRDTLVRFYWPYLLLVTVFMIGMNCATQFSHFSWNALFRLYVFCDGSTIKQMCGVQVFWFLPSMMCLVLLKEWYYRSNSYVRFFLATLSITYIGCVIYSNGSYDTFPSWHEITRHFPLGSSYAIQMLVPGLALRWLVGIIDRKQWYRKSLIISTLGFAISSIVFLKYVGPTIGLSDRNVVNAILQNLTPVIFMVMVVSALRFATIKESGPVGRIGVRSLYIYIFSPFVGYVYAFVCFYLHMNAWWVGVLIWPLITITAYFISTFFIRGAVVDILFPRNFSSLKLSIGLSARN